MKGGKTPIHIMRWAPADFLADPFVMMLVADGRYEAYVFYRQFIDVSFLEGGKIRNDLRLLSALSGLSEEYAEAARDFCVEAGKLQVADGWIFHPRVVREVEREMSFRETQGPKSAGQSLEEKRAAGRRSAEARRAKFGTAQPPNNPRTEPVENCPPEGPQAPNTLRTGPEQAPERPPNAFGRTPPEQSPIKVATAQDSSRTPNGPPSPSPAPSPAPEIRTERPPESPQPVENGPPGVGAEPERQELLEVCTAIGERQGRPTASVVVQVAAIPPSNGHAGKSFADPYAKGISIEWVRAALWRAKELQLELNKPVPL